jgi:hypothetical protein
MVSSSWTVLTASDAATAIGVNKYETPLTTFFEKSVVWGLVLWAMKPQDMVKNTKMRLVFSMKRDMAKSSTKLVFPHPVHNGSVEAPMVSVKVGKLVEIKCPMSRKIEPSVFQNITCHNYNSVWKF